MVANQSRPGFVWSSAANDWVPIAGVLDVNRSYDFNAASTIGGNTIINNTMPISGFRNAIINGGFDIWQRGASGSGSGYSADRWRNNNPTSWVQSTDVPEPFFRYSMKGTGSSSQPLFRYHFETADAIKLAGKTQTLSVWIKATSGVPVIFGIHTSTTVDNSSTGTWTDSVGQTFYTASGSWERKTMTVTFPSTVKSIRVQVGANANITGDLFFTGVQLEHGSIATPFEQRPIGTELTLCQRYYEKSYDLGTAPGTAATGAGSFYVWGSTQADGFIGAAINFKVPKRTSSYTFTGYSPALGNANTFDILRAGTVTQGVAISGTLGAGETSISPYIQSGANNALARLYGQWSVSAEL